MDWQMAGVVGAIVIGLYNVFSKTFDKSLSLREHDEFRANLNDNLKLIRDHIREDLNRIERRVELIEQTRPTTGELSARIGPSNMGVPRA